MHAHSPYICDCALIHRWARSNLHLGLGAHGRCLHRDAHLYVEALRRFKPGNALFANLRAGYGRIGLNESGDGGDDDDGSEWVFILWFRLGAGVVWLQ